MSINSDHLHDMGTGMASPPSTNINATKLMMHMTFFWGKDAENLFSGWPGTSKGMYMFALVTIFVFGVVVEWLSHCEFIKQGSNNVVAGIVQTFMHAMKIGLAYMVMLAVMSFSGGVFLAAVAGHALGFLIFGSNMFKKIEMPYYERTFDHPQMSF